MPDILDFFLDGANIRTVTEKQLDPRTVPDNLYFLQRTPVLPATDRELTAQYRGTAVIADLIAMDARSMVYRMVQMRTTEQEIPKIKFGTYLHEREMRDILQLGQAQLNATNVVPAFVRRLFTFLLGQVNTGRRWRLETMIVGSILNTFSYDRMGIKLASGWNKDSALTVTLSPGTETPATSLPITAIRNLKDYARIVHGVNLNRLVTSRAAFDQMSLTDEFKTEAQSVLLSLFTLTTLPSTTQQQRIDAFKRMTLFDEVVLYDSHYRWEDGAGVRSLQRILPIGDMILDSTDNDNNPERRYLGNAGVTESAVINRVGARQVAEGANVDLQGMQDGPFFYTSVDPELDPPSIRARVVQHAWPILREPNNSAVIHSGTVTESIPIVDTF